MEIIKSLKAYLYDKTISPLFGAFIFSWAAVNYKFLIIVFSSDKYFEKIEGVNLLYDYTYDIKGYSIPGRLHSWLFAPLFLAILYIVIYPILSAPVYKYSLWMKRWLRNIKNKSESKRIFTIEESREVTKQLAAMEIENQELIDKSIEENRRFLDNLNSLEVENEKLVNEKKELEKTLQNTVASKAELIDDIKIKDSDNNEKEEQSHSVPRSPSNKETASTDNDPIVGIWLWSDGSQRIIRNDLSVVELNHKGFTTTWRKVNGGYLITYSTQNTCTITISEDGQKIVGLHSKGYEITAERIKLSKVWNKKSIVGTTWLIYNKDDSPTGELSIEKNGRVSGWRRSFNTGTIKDMSYWKWDFRHGRLYIGVSTQTGGEVTFSADGKSTILNRDIGRHEIYEGHWKLKEDLPENKIDNKNETGIRVLMQEYIVNKNAHTTGEHEVHKAIGCSRPPGASNAISLGEHADCQSALHQAKKYYDNVEVCMICCYASKIGEEHEVAKNIDNQGQNIELTDQAFILLTIIVNTNSSTIMLAEDMKGKSVVLDKPQGTELSYFLDNFNEVEIEADIADLIELQLLQKKSNDTYGVMSRGRKKVKLSENAYHIFKALFMAGANATMVLNERHRGNENFIEVDDKACDLRDNAKYKQDINNLVEKGILKIISESKHKSYYEFALEFG